MQVKVILLLLIWMTFFGCQGKNENLLESAGSNLDDNKILIGDKNELSLEEKYEMWPFISFFNDSLSIRITSKTYDYHDLTYLFKVLD